MKQKNTNMYMVVDHAYNVSIKYKLIQLSFFTWMYNL